MIYLCLGTSYCSTIKTEVDYLSIVTKLNFFTIAVANDNNFCKAIKEELFMECDICYLTISSQLSVV